MIALACVLAYLATALYAGRRLYSVRRARAIDKRAAEHAERRYIRRDPVKEFNEYDQDLIAFESTVLALFWPLAMAGFGVYRYVTASPELSRTEAAAERERMAGRIRELERELGIKEAP